MSFFGHIPRLLLGIFLLLAVFPERASGQAHVEEEKKHSWFSFSKPSKSNPSDQMDYAQDLLRAKKLRKAGKAFRSLAITWPSSAEAPLAQWAYARILDERGKMEDAFDAYQVLLDRHGGRFPEYQQVLTRQFEIAKSIMGKKRGVIIFGGFEAPERAIPYFESVIRNGPRSPHAPEAQYLIGEAYESNYEYNLAVVAYSSTVHRYPLSAFAERASFGRARSLHTLSKTYPNNPQYIDEAWAGTMAFLRAYPGSENKAEAETMRDEILQRRAKNAFAIVEYYDKIARRPQVALESYRNFVQVYPNTKWTDTARQRITELEATLTVKNEGSSNNE
jgi:outer membrane protein assembly factor BamD (BamD/ComL family)